jgi:RNA polymerase sigma-70 factor (ECF subfamily)
VDIEIRLKALMLRGLDGDAAAYRECLAVLGVRLRLFRATDVRRARRCGGSCAGDAAGGASQAVDLGRVPIVHRLGSCRGALQADRPLARKVRQTLPIEDHIESGRRRAEPSVGLELDRALASLPDRQRILVSDVKLTGLSLAEAGARAGISEGAAKVALHRALKALAERMRRAD